MSDRIRFTVGVVVPLILLLASGSGPVAAANPAAPTYTIIDLGSLGGTYGSAVAWRINEQGQVVVNSTGPADGDVIPFRAFLWEARTGMQDLGSLGGASSYASGINEQGQVVGYSETSAGDFRAFLWEAGTGMQDLGSLGGLGSYASFINARGQIVGASNPGLDGAHAFLWEAGTGMQDLGTLSGAYSYPTGINEQGQIIGSSDVWPPCDDDLHIPGCVHAFVWEAGAGMQDLAPGLVRGSAPSGINEQGQVVGRYETDRCFRAFLWEAGTGMQDLGSLGGPCSYASGINARGQVIGDSTGADGYFRAFLWEAGTGMQDLGSLGLLGSAQPFGINARGQVIGNSLTAAHETHAFLWEAGTGMHDLGTLGGAFSTAYSINCRGQIVGESTAATGVRHAVLWEPTPFVVALDCPSRPIPVSIDIKPGGLPNSINSKSHGSIPVAILSSATFDAPKEVNVTSLTFGRTGSEASLRFCSPTPEDVNADGFLDTVCHFKTQATGFLPGDVVGALKGRMVSGALIEGTDSVKIVK